MTFRPNLIALAILLLPIAGCTSKPSPGAAAATNDAAQPMAGEAETRVSGIREKPSSGPLSGGVVPSDTPPHAIDPHLVHSCPCSVLGTRPPGANEKSVEERFPRLADPENARESIGPGGLRAVMKPDERLHPHIFLVDSATGASRPLLGQTLATNPRFSPDGERIACSAWRSKTRPWILTIVHRSSGKVVEPPVGSLSAKFKWSPDSRWLAVEGTVFDTSLRALTILDGATGRVVGRDTVGIVANYEFAWSPDSRLVAVVRPVEIDDHEEILRSELWIFDLGGRKCQLSQPRAGLVSHPAWIDNHLLRIEQARPVSQAGTAAMVLDVACQTLR